MEIEISVEVKRKEDGMEVIAWGFLESYDTSGGFPVRHAVNKLLSFLLDNGRKRRLWKSKCH